MSYRCSRASGMAQLVKNPPAMQETAFNAGDLVQSLGQEDPLEKEMAAHSSILENPMDSGAWWTIQSMRLQRVRHD